jgi:hypothetical protein
MRSVIPGQLASRSSLNTLRASCVCGFGTTAVEWTLKSSGQGAKDTGVYRECANVRRESEPDLDSGAAPLPERKSSYPSQALSLSKPNLLCTRRDGLPAGIRDN